MSTIEKIAINSGSLLTGRIVTKIISLFTVTFLFRYLGAELYGKYAFAFAYISFFTIISDLGLHNILVRETSQLQEKKNKILGNAILMATIFSLLAFLMALISINVLNYPESTKTLIGIAATTLLLGIVAPYGVIYEISFKMKYSVFFSLFSRLFLLVSIYFITLYDLGIFWMAAMTVFADAIHHFLVVIYSKKIIKPVFKYDYKICKRLFIESLPLALSSLFVLIFFRIDVVMLSMMKGDYSVGIYSSAFRLTEAVLFVPSTFMVSIFPLLSQYFKKSEKTFYFTYLKSLKYLFNSAFILAFVLTLNSYDIILYICGIDFIEGSYVFKILSWATAILFLNYLFGNLLISVGKQKINTLATFISATANIIINYTLIPQYDFTGAAFATVITQLLNMVIMLYYIKEQIHIRMMYLEMKESFVSAIIMIIYAYIGSLMMPKIALLITSIIIYFLALYHLNGIDDYDKKICWKLINIIKKR